MCMWMYMAKKNSVGCCGSFTKTAFKFNAPITVLHGKVYFEESAQDCGTNLFTNLKIPPKKRAHEVSSHQKTFHTV